MIDKKDIAVGVFVAFASVVLLIRCIYKRATENNPYDRLTQMTRQSSLGLSLKNFTYEELSEATDGFSNLLGEGAFGCVYKGLLPEGLLVAVKQLKPGTASDQEEQEFLSEVKVISHINHKNLVSLVGYCFSNNHKMLVYKFVPNETLQIHLHGKDRPAMDWSKRIKVAIGSAKGLEYLHENCNPKIIHRDIKAANIILTDDFEPQIADFGLAKFFPDTNSNVYTRVVGTIGYLDPLYQMSGQLSETSDVYSFGVVLLELITGRKPVYSTDSSPDVPVTIVHWARPFLSQHLEIDNFKGFVDPRLEDRYNHDEMIRMIACAKSCVSEKANHRAPMSLVAKALEGIVSLDDLKVGRTSGESDDDMKKFKNLVEEASREQGSSEHIGPSSEYAQHPSASTSSD